MPEASVLRVTPNIKRDSIKPQELEMLLTFVVCLFVFRKKKKILSLSSSLQGSHTILTHQWAWPACCTSLYQTLLSSEFHTATWVGTYFNSMHKLRKSTEAYWLLAHLPTLLWITARGKSQLGKTTQRVLQHHPDLVQCKQMTYWWLKCSYPIRWKKRAKKVIKAKTKSEENEYECNGRTKKKRGKGQKNKGRVDSRWGEESREMG